MGKLFKQGIAEFGVIVIQAPLQARGKQGETFQQTLDMRVGTFARRQLESPRDFRIALGELAAGMPQPGQFALVIIKQLRINRVAHGAPPAPDRRAR